MRKKVISCVICALMFTAVFFILTPMKTCASTTTIEYQVGTREWPTGEIWSPWVSDGQVANITTNIGGPTFSIRIRAPGRHVEYQIGAIQWNYSEMWSPWMSDGDIASVSTGLAPSTFMIKIIAPGCHIEYQVGTRQWPTIEMWSPWVSNGQVAQISTNMAPMTFKMRAILVAPAQATIDIDPNTLNLKSRGNWITCYIEFSEDHDVHDIIISTIMLEDVIPAEWGDVQNDTLMVKFDRSEVEDMLSPGTYNLKVTGELADGTKFEGYSDEIRVIDPGK